VLATNDHLSYTTFSGRIDNKAASFEFSFKAAGEVEPHLEFVTRDANCASLWNRFDAMTG